MASKKSDKAVFWRQHISKYRASGQTRAAYCRQHGLKLHRLAYHVGKQSKVGLSGSSFAEVAIADVPVQTGRGGARLLVGGGVAVEFDAGTDPAWVARLVAAVGGRQ